MLINRFFFVVISLIDYRCFGLFGWLHEHCIGSNGRICKRSIEKQIRRCIHPRKQCAIHFNAEATSVNRLSIINKIKSSHAYHQFRNSIINQQFFFQFFNRVSFRSMKLTNLFFRFISFLKQKMDFYQ